MTNDRGKLKNISFVNRAAFTAMILLAGQAANANIVLPNAIAEAEAYGPFVTTPGFTIGVTTAAQSYTYTGNQQASYAGSASATIDGTQAPYVSAVANGVTTANAGLTYYMEIVDPLIFTAATVPVHVSATLAANIDPASLAVSYSVGAYSHLTVGSQGTLFVNDLVYASNTPASGRCATPIASCADSLSITVDMPVNQQIAIDMGSVAGTNGVADYASAFIDPYFTIDPSAANPGDYSLVFSADIGNNPVPEPTSLLLTFGVAALGYARAKRR